MALFRGPLKFVYSLRIKLLCIFYLESALTASLCCSSGVDVAVGTNRGAWYDIFGVGGAL